MAVAAKDCERLAEACGKPAGEAPSSCSAASDSSLSLVLRTRTTPTVATRGKCSGNAIDRISESTLFAAVPERLYNQATQGPSSKTSCTYGAPASMRIAFSGQLRGDGSVCGTSNRGWRSLGGRHLPVMTQIPLQKQTRAGKGPTFCRTRKREGRPPPIRSLLRDRVS